jgi:hypothetical protein
MREFPIGSFSQWKCEKLYRIYDISIKYTDRLKKKLDRDMSSPLDYCRR